MTTARCSSCGTRADVEAVTLSDSRGAGSVNICARCKAFITADRCRVCSTVLERGPAGSLEFDDPAPVCRDCRLDLFDAKLNAPMEVAR